MRIYLESLGCRLNYAEMTALGRQLVGAGHELASSAAEADLCVLNSCTVTAEADRQSRQLARQLARANPSARLIVTGCYATLEAETVATLPNVSLVVGNARKDELLTLVQEFGKCPKQRGTLSQMPETMGHAVAISNIQCPKLRGTLYPIPNTQSLPRTRAFIKVQDGCRNHCTYCIVAVARGEERSRPIGEVVAEVNALHAEGLQEAVLTGVHLAGYGSDNGADLAALVIGLLAETAIPRLRLSSLEPFDLTPDFFDLWAESAGRLMPHLHLPAQSGSDAVLRRMARRNRVADFEALAAAARAAIPDLTITTDLIAGFPGETEADFAETVAFAHRVGFAHLHVFPYSPREGTAAARFAGQVAVAERKRRARVLHDLDAELGRAAREAFVGQVRSVLWENRVAPPTPQYWGEPGGQNAPQPFDFAQDKHWGDRGAVWSGLTDNYLRVHAVAPAGLDLHNRITPARLVRLEQDELWGELLTR